MTDNKEIGLQFFKNYLALSPLGKHVITRCLGDIDNSPDSKQQFKALKTKYFNFLEKIVKKSAGKPSITGLFRFFIDFNAALISSKVRIPSNLFDSC